MKLDEIGKQIKKLRKESQMTQQHLSDIAGISRVTLGKIERGEMGNVSIKRLDIILDALGYELSFKHKNQQSFGLPTLDELG